MLARVNQGKLEEAARSGGGGGKEDDDDLSGVYVSDESRRDMDELDAYMGVSVWRGGKGGGGGGGSWSPVPPIPPPPSSPAFLPSRL